MPMFFLISGYLYNEKTELKPYIIKKFQTLYIPFITWNLAAFLIKQLPNLSSLPMRSVRHFFEIVLTLEKDGQFFGATWFLGALFIISVVFKCFDNTVKAGNYQGIVLLVLFSGIGICGFEIDLPYRLSRTMICGMFFAIGNVVREKRKLISFAKPYIPAILGCILFVYLGNYNTVSMGRNSYTYKSVFVTGAILASFGVIVLSKYIEKLQWTWMKRTFLFLGRNSMDIMIWHFVMFRIVIAIQVIIADTVTITDVSTVSFLKAYVKEILQYYPVFDSQGLWGGAYILVGILGSVLMGKLLRIGSWGRWLKRLHIVG